MKDTEIEIPILTLISNTAVDKPFPEPIRNIVGDEMSDFDYFENWNKTFRWISFIPMLIIAYVITFFVGKYVFWYGFGWMGMDGESGIGFFIYHFYLSFVGFCIPLMVSVSCAPKGRITIASIYLGVLLLLLGFSTFSLIVYGDGRPVWQSAYDYTLNICGGILALVATISEQKRIKDDEKWVEEISA